MLDNAVNHYGSYVMNRLNELTKEGKQKYTLEEVLFPEKYKRSSKRIEALFAGIGVPVIVIDASQIPEADRLRRPGSSATPLDTGYLQDNADERGESDDHHASLQGQKNGA